MSQAPAPERLIENGIPTETLVAHVVAKYADHTPLYRQAQIYARQGITLDRSTLADWVDRAAFALRPVHARLLEQLKQSTELFADETTAPVLDPGRGCTKKGQLWAYARDERPWQGPDPPDVAYVYAPDRKHARPAEHLTGFSGTLQVDGYGAYAELAEGGEVELAFCWSHYLEHSLMWSSCGIADFPGPKRVTSAHQTPHNPHGRMGSARRVRGRHCRSRFGRYRASRRISHTRNGVMPACRAVPCIHRAAAHLLAMGPMRA